MSEGKRLLSLALIMVLVSLMVMSVTIVMLFRADISQHREYLVATVQSQARLIEAVARYDALHEKEHGIKTPGGSLQATMSQIIDAHGNYEGFGSTGEFTLARLNGVEIEFIMQRHYDSTTDPKSVPFDSTLAEPMRLALQGLSGSIIGLDYRGKTVMAAYEPLNLLNMGLVFKIDLAEIRKPFIKTGLTAAAFAFMLILGGTALFFRLGQPIIVQLRKHTLALNKEISERKQTEEALRESEQRHRAIMQSAHDAIVTSDQAGKIVGWNLGAEALFGYTKTEAMDQPLTILIPERYREGHIAGMKRIDSGGPHHVFGKTIEVFGLRKDQSEFPLEVSFARWETDTGWFVTAIIRDSTERKQAETVLRVSSEQYKNLFVESPLGIALIDSLRGLFYEVNPMFAQIAGRTPEEMAHIDCMRITHPDDIQKDLDNMELMNSGKISGFQMDKRYLRPDGSVVWVNMTIARVRVETNVSPRHLCMIKDITELKRIEEQLQIRQRMDSLGTLVGGIAHDFNNILGALKGNIELLSMHNDNLTEKQNKYLGNATKSTNRAIELTKQFQTLSTASHNNKTRIDLHDIAEEVFGLLEETTNRLIRKEIKFNKGEFLVSANSGELHQILLNLATNSAHSLEQKEVTNSDYIRITAQNYQVKCGDRTGLSEGDYVHISFKDTGCGMSEEVLNRAFDPMFTTKNKGTRRGQGLGLAMVYNIITKHHQGFIEIGSREGMGTTFHIYLPQAQAEIPAESKKTVATQGGIETILVVDDDEMVASMAEEMLMQAGYTVLTAHDGMEALKTYAEKVDLIAAVVLDLNMPRMSGKQVFEEMIKINPEVRVIISSGYGEDHSRQGILSAAKGNLSKPYELKELSQVVRNVLDA